MILILSTKNAFLPLIFRGGRTEGVRVGTEKKILLTSHSLLVLIFRGSEKIKHKLYQKERSKRETPTNYVTKIATICAGHSRQVEKKKDVCRSV